MCFWGHENMSDLDSSFWILGGLIMLWTFRILHTPLFPHYKNKKIQYRKKQAIQKYQLGSGPIWGWSRKRAGQTLTLKGEKVVERRLEWGPSRCGQLCDWFSGPPILTGYLSTCVLQQWVSFLSSPPHLLLTASDTFYNWRAFISLWPCHVWLIPTSIALSTFQARANNLTLWWGHQTDIA